MSYYGEVRQRQGTWVTRHTQEADAAAWVAARSAVQAATVNPVLASSVRAAVVLAELDPPVEVPCPECTLPVSASIGIHFDCRP